MRHEKHAPKNLRVKFFYFEENVSTRIYFWQMLDIILNICQT